MKKLCDFKEGDRFPRVELKSKSVERFLPAAAECQAGFNTQLECSFVSNVHCGSRAMQLSMYASSVSS